MFCFVTENSRLLALLPKEDCWLCCCVAVLLCCFGLVLVVVGVVAADLPHLSWGTSLNSHLGACRK